MKNLVSLFVIVFAFYTTAMASDIAFYVGAPNTDGWYDVATQTADVATIISETGHLFGDIRKFNDNQLFSFGTWVDNNTNDGEMDIIWLNGCMPSCLYQFPNVNPDGSRAEKWLDGGNMIINVGDWFAYCSFEGGYRQPDNGSSGAENILDLYSGIILMADNTSLRVTSTGRQYLPSLHDPVTTYRPIVLSAIVTPWEVAAVFAQNSAGMADPVVIHNKETDGYVAFINQASGGPGVWIEDRGLTCAELIENWVCDVIGLGGNPFARSPSPADSALHKDTWVTLSWIPGDFAASHDVYFGENLNDVEGGIHGTFQGNQTSTYFDVGLYGSPYPNGLTPGTTYYWRIDEIEAGDTKHKGDVWSFTTGSLNAYNPFPADGSRFVDLNVTLSWTAGFGDMSHNVYFGDDFDDVDGGVGGTFRANKVSTSYNLNVLYPGGLNPGKTYYWRIDEVESGGGNTYKGDVWSFTATISGLGTIVQDKWNNIYSDDLNALKNHPSYPDSPDETTVLTRFETGDNLGENYGGRIHGWLYAPLTGDYTFWICSDDQSELWLSKDEEPRNVQLIAYVKDSPTASTGWTDRNVWAKYPSQKSSPVRLTAGDKYYIMALWKEGVVDDFCQVAWEGPGIPMRTIIPGCYLSAEPVGTYPQPADGARIGNKTPALSWNPREAGVAYDVYFGTSFNLVNTVNRQDQSGVYRGRQIVATYTTEQLVLGRTYYWRIDEVESNGWTINKGSIWSFTVVNVDTVEYQVSSSEDDGYAANDQLQNLSSDFLKAGLSTFSEPPYYISGMVFRNVNIPQGTEIISAHLKIYSYDSSLTDILYGKFEAEDSDDSVGLGGSWDVGSLAVTVASVNWDHYEPWEENTWYESPDIADVIQEVIDRGGWQPGNSLTILYGTRENDGGYRNFSSYERGSDLAPKLEITYVPR